MRFFLVNVYNGFKFCWVPHVNIFPLADVHQPQIPFGKILTYLVSIWAHLIIF
jgi:hypothetical protein